MELPSLAPAGESGDGRSRLDDQGFILVALLVAMAISAIWLGTMLPAWRQQAVRQREGDLLFRGQQYARAIALFYLANNCTLPNDVDILVSRHYLRKKWKDPIADDDFVPLMAGMSASLSGAPSGTPQNSGRPSAPPSAPGGSAQLVGVYGVSSKSTDTSIMVYKNQQQYSLWSFRYTDALQTMGRSASCNNTQGPNGGAPGTPGRGPGNGPGGGPPGGPTTGRDEPGRDGTGRTGDGVRPPGPPPPGIGNGRPGGGSAIGGGSL